MTQLKKCSTCGTVLPPDAPAGVCPRCLLKAGMDDSANACADDATLVGEPRPTVSRRDEQVTEPDTSLSSDVSPAGTKVRYFGDYELLEEISRGGMGVVYRARQTRLNRMVAVKMILAGQLASEADVRRFQTEAEAVAILDHPGIVPIFEVGEHDGHHFYSMALVDGESLADQIARKPLSPVEAAKLVRTISLAVAYAHQKDVIHRDLKPSNILIDQNGEPRVVDFGLARRKSIESSLTAAGQVLGTPGYMPPEQASGNTDLVRESADIYGLGAILYAILTGRPPFEADSAIDTLKQVADCDPVPPSAINPDVNTDMQTIVLKCLEKRREDRYSTAAELAEELQRYLTGVPIRARPVSMSHRIWRWGQRRPLVSGLVSALIVAVLAIGGLAWQMSSGSPADVNLTPEVAGNLVSEAASIPNEEWTAIASASTMPSPASLDNHTLSLILFSLFGQSLDQIDGHPNAADDFHYENPQPKPFQIAQAIWISKAKGYASFVQPEYITDCTVQQEADTAHGTVTFNADGLYSGRIEYVARQRGGVWGVEEFHLPNFGVSLRRNDNGKWINMTRAIEGDSSPRPSE